MGKVIRIRQVRLLLATVFGAVLMAVAVVETLWLSERRKNMILEPISESISVTYYMFTDVRDGKVYKTVVIGGKRWMAENLNYQTDSSWCYNDSDSYCKKYGRLYNWDAAMDACPSGWHLPTRQEWDSLIVAVGGIKNPHAITPMYWDSAGAKLKAKNGWRNNYRRKSGNGDDSYGFSALPGGSRDDGIFFNVGIFGEWWTATEDGYNSANDRYMNNENSKVHGSESARGEKGHGTGKACGSSVRCVQND